MRSLFVLLVLLSALLSANATRPVVRTIKDAKQLSALLEKHRDVTGLPVILDFYSESCGPCRMIAPAFKKLAQEYEGRAVFAKIDINRSNDIAAKYQVRSMPTFVFIVDGKKENEFAGAGEQQLQQFTRLAVDKAESNNVKISQESLALFYKENDPGKDEASVKSVYDKCVELTKKKNGVLCVGGAATELSKKLKSKYKKAPKLEKRFLPVDVNADDDDVKPAAAAAGGAKPSSGTAAKPGDKKTAPPAQQKEANGQQPPSSPPDITAVPLVELQAELERRKVLAADAAADSDDEDEEESDGHFWQPSDFPERVVIVGGGPAGLSAAIYAARAGLRPVVVAPPLGGQLAGKGVDVENYPGLPGMTGPEIVLSMRKQAEEFGATFEGEAVLRIDASKRPFKLYTNSSEITTHAIILATGADSKWLDVPGEWDLRGGGVSSCATCDGFLFKDEDVVVVGGGDTAMEDALVLARTSKSVTILHRKGEFRASAILATRVLNHPKITVRWHTTVKEILGKIVSSSDSDGGDAQTVSTRNVVASVVAVDVNTKVEVVVPCAAVFVAIGHSPNTSIMSGIVDFNPHHPGYVSVKAGTTATSVLGIFAAGDVADAVYRQAITSAGAGAAAALDAERYLSENNLGNEEELFNVELLKELAELSGQMKGGDGEESGGYNAYGEAGVGKGQKEDTKKPKVEKKTPAPEAATPKSNNDDDDHIEL